MGMRINEWHKLDIERKVNEYFPNIVGSINAVEGKESNLQWANDFGSPAEHNNDLAIGSQLYRPTIQQGVAFTAIMFLAAVGGIALAFATEFLLCRKQAQNRDIGTSGEPPAYIYSICPQTNSKYFECD